VVDVLVLQPESITAIAAVASAVDFDMKPHIVMRRAHRAGLTLRGAGRHPYRRERRRNIDQKNRKNGGSPRLSRSVRQSRNHSLGFRIFAAVVARRIDALD